MMDGCMDMGDEGALDARKGALQRLIKDLMLLAGPEKKGAEVEVKSVAVGGEEAPEEAVSEMIEQPEEEVAAEIPQEDEDIASYKRA